MPSPETTISTQKNLGPTLFTLLDNAGGSVGGANAASKGPAQGYFRWVILVADGGLGEHTFGSCQT